MDESISRKFSDWQKALGLDDYLILLERISIWQVVGEDGRRGASLVGIIVNRKTKVANLVHTRNLSENDIVHEFWHLRDPDLTHEEVESETSRLLGLKNGENETVIIGSKERF